MHSHAGKTSGQEHKSNAQNTAAKKAAAVSPLQFKDQRAVSGEQQTFQQHADSSGQVQQLKAYQSMADSSPRIQQATGDNPIQRKNNTGLPNQLKTGIESLSGVSLDDTQVHYNSSKPAQLNAHAYAQGNQIHVAAGQEKHLPHEAWHVVQQKQGRVKPTTMLKGKTAVNDDAGLEREADVMGQKAMQLKAFPADKLQEIKAQESPRAGVAQRVLVPFKTPAAPTADDNQIIADAGAIEALTAAAYTNTWNRLNNAAAAPLGQAMFPGVTAGHFANFVNVLQGHNNALKAAATGYVIEDQVSFHAGLPGNVATQVVDANARLDFVSTHNGAKGAIDVTSSGEQGHILNKRFNKGSYHYLAESTYQSIDFNNLNGGAAPQLGGAALALGQAAKVRRANSALRSRLAAHKRLGEMLSNGVMRGNKQFLRQRLRVKMQLNGLLGRNDWTQAKLDAVDKNVRNMNILLRAARAEPIDLISTIIDDMHDRYLVAGLPEW